MWHFSAAHNLQFLQHGHFLAVQGIIQLFNRQGKWIALGISVAVYNAEYLGIILFVYNPVVGIAVFGASLVFHGNLYLLRFPSERHSEFHFTVRLHHKV